MQGATHISISNSQGSPAPGQSHNPRPQSTGSGAGGEGLQTFGRRTLCVVLFQRFDIDRRPFKEFEEELLRFAFQMFPDQRSI